MIKLSFQLSKAWNKIEQVDLRLADRVALRYDLFLGDIFFFIDNADFSMPVGWVPILDFAIGLLAISKQLQDGRTDVKFEFTESNAQILFCKCSGSDLVQLTANYTLSVADVALVDLVRIVTEFALEVRGYLLHQYPELDNNLVFLEMFHAFE